MTVASTIVPQIPERRQRREQAYHQEQPTDALHLGRRGAQEDRYPAGSREPAGLADLTPAVQDEANANAYPQQEQYAINRAAPAVHTGQQGMKGHHRGDPAFG